MSFSYLMTSFAVLHFRTKKSKTPFNAPFKTPLYPYLPIISIVALMAFMIGLPNEALLIGVIFIIVLTVVYYLLMEYEGKKIIRVKLFK
jgi:APA family basic amino acid/polyamine antiporter